MTSAAVPASSPTNTAVIGTRMPARTRRLHGLLAGVGVFLVDVWPLVLIGWAGSSGSVGDLSELQLVGVGLTYSIVVGAIAGWSMTVALQRAEVSPKLGRFDPWGAYAVGIGVYNVALAALLGLMYLLLLDQENQSLRDRAWLVYLLWIAGHVVVAVIGFGAARALLGRDLRERPAVTPPSGPHES